MEDSLSWIVFSYKVASETSTLRVRAWRAFKKIGVLYMQQSVCVVPETPEVRRKVQQMQDLIRESGGETLLLDVTRFSDHTEQDLIALFNNQRSVEYGEFIESCHAFQKEIDMETAKGTAHDVKENEAKLAKLQKRYRKILRRDYFKSSMANPAGSILDECEASFHNFARQVYRSEECFAGSTTAADD